MANYPEPEDCRLGRHWRPDYRDGLLVLRPNRDFERGYGYRYDWPLHLHHHAVTYPRHRIFGVGRRHRIKG